jgi:serine/threonine-protein kinase
MAATTSPTLSVHATQAGLILGTAAYMAPEQALGKAVDKRADIWAFGVVVFEMLTGRRPFGGGDEVVATIASVVKDAPLFAELPAETPASLRRLLRRCLEKDPRQRLADIADARLEIGDALEGKPEPPVSTTQTSGWRRERVWQLLAALLAVVAAAGWWSWSRQGRSIVPSQQSVLRVDLDLGSDVSLESIGTTVILSPDGTRLVYVSKRSDERTRLLTKLLDQPNRTEIPGTDDAYSPFFAPDGRWVGFFAAGKLKKVRLDGGQVVSLCDASAGRGASWSEDGSFIVAALDNQSALVRIPADGGTPTPITRFAGEERSHRWPQVLPGHNRVLFTVNSSPGNFANSGVAVVSFGDSGPPSEHRVLFAEAGMSPRYLASGYLTFVRKGTLYAAPFDVKEAAARGEPVAILDEVSNEQYFGGVQLDLSRGGSLIYHRGATLGFKTIQWLDSASTLQSLVGEPGMYTYPRVSPDGERLAISLPDGLNADIWVYAWRTGTRTRVTEGRARRRIRSGVRMAATSCLRGRALCCGALPTRLKGPRC